MGDLGEVDCYYAYVTEFRKVSYTFILNKF